MKNYICINNKKKIPITDYQLSELKKQFGYDDIIKLTEPGRSIIFPLTDLIQIGWNAAPESLRGRCLVVKKDVDILVEKNYDDNYFPKRIIFKRK